MVAIECISLEPRLTATQKAVLLVIWQLSVFGRFEKAVFPSIETIGRHTGLSGPTVSKTVRQLEEARVLTVDRGGYNRSNHYRLRPVEDWLFPDDPRLFARI